MLSATVLLLETIAVFIIAVTSAPRLYASDRPSAGDSTNAYILNRILVEGNKTTKSFIILRELPFKRGDTVNAREVEYGRERIYSTGLFARVETLLEPLNNGRSDLLIYVRERWYIWPYPKFGFRDRDLKKIYVGAGLVDFNFSGMDDRLEGMFALGYDPFGSIMYTNPAVGKQKKYVLTLGADYSHGRNVGIQSGSSSGQFNDTFADLYAEAGRRFGIYSLLSVGASYNYVRRNTNVPGLVLSPTGKDEFASLKLEYLYDSRNIKSYATEGTYLYLGVQKYGLGQSDVDFGRFSFDARDYVPLTDYLSFAFRLHGNFAEGPRIAPYNHVFMGYYERIRGMFNTISEGESLVGGNAEFRVPIIKNIHFALPDFPLKQYISNTFGLYWSFFFDAGETSNKRLDLNVDRTLYGYGGGLVFLFPYDIVIQADFARGGNKRTQFILDFGAAI